MRDLNLEMLYWMFLVPPKKIGRINKIKYVAKKIDSQVPLFYFLNSN